MRYVILGLIQGLTEFLPVSSSSHLIISQNLLGVEITGIAFDIFVHLGTSLAVVLWFKQELIEIISSFFKSIFKLNNWDNFSNYLKEDSYCKFAWLLVISTIPAALIGYFFQDILEQTFQNFYFIAAMLIITGSCLVLTDRFFTQNYRIIEELNFVDALLIGLAQALAIIPGISRSGFTIMMSLGRGLERNLAAKYSFILSVPIVIGASLYKCKEIFQLNINIFILLISGFIAFISGYLAIGFFIKILTSHKLRFFGYYLWVFAALIFFIKIKN
ncbi:MAG TPA: undecaprenyl-diphosphate phosphatase [Atribacterota bacterium]|nr:undecaprenyl-diphosphate phosphatase [Atribacterota bacterium]